MSVVLLPPIRHINALKNGAAITDRVDMGNPASVTNLTKLSVLSLSYMTAAQDGGQILSKWNFTGALGWNGPGLFGVTQISMRWERATTDLVYVSNTGFWPLNRWFWVAGTLDQGGTAGQMARIYIGPYGGSLAEVTYASQTDGTGTFGVDTTRNLIIGNLTTNATPWKGLIAMVGLYRGVLTLPEFQQMIATADFQPSRAYGLWLPGKDGAGVVRDESGNGLHGTITGAIPVAGVPLMAVRSRARTITLAKAPNTFSLTAAGGTFAETGGVITTKIKTPVAGGSYTETGGAALPKIKLLSAAGTYALTGGSATLRAALRLTAVGGSYALTGGAALPKIKLSSVGGSYSLTGGAALTKVKLLAGAGTYALTGGAATLRAGFRLTAAAGAYVLTGGSATLRGGFRVTAVGGSYALTGGSASLIAVSRLVASGGSYTTAGSSITPKIKTPAGSGTYAESGGSIVARIKLSVSGGTYSLSGSAVVFPGFFSLPALSGSYGLSGSSARGKLSTPVAAGSYALSGTPTVWRLKLLGAGGSYSLAGSVVVFRSNTHLVATTGAFNLTGSAITTRVKLPFGAGAYALTGTAAAFGHTGGTADSRRVVTVGTQTFTGAHAEDLTFATARAGEVSLV